MLTDKELQAFHNELIEMQNHVVTVMSAKYPEIWKLAARDLDNDLQAAVTDAPTPVARRKALSVFMFSDWLENQKYYQGFAVDWMEMLNE
ncbi:hypothetical protein UFOVP810_59 [uncultured Caudovirales phage]|uniref:Uncharacterized protein n=1 Tax=uncultured Caudovirales phage TaxID=2100421 RepID=A0A6J5NVS2_9CAUD|nr:hypothetical protein UFOVP810_59 [uncultured Caudovirales phage]